MKTDTDTAAAEQAGRTLEAALVRQGVPRERAHLEVFAFQLGLANELMAGIRTTLEHDQEGAPRWSSRVFGWLRESPMWDALCASLRGDRRALDAGLVIFVEVAALAPPVLTREEHAAHRLAQVVRELAATYVVA